MKHDTAEVLFGIIVLSSTILCFRANKALCSELVRVIFDQSF